jgi:sugar lactone lactonase YvrE
MAKILWKRANKTSHANNYLGANGEVVIDMEQNRIFLYDGANAYVSNTFASAPGTTYSPPAVEEEVVVAWSLSNITGVEATGVWASPPVDYAMHVSPDGKNYFTIDTAGDSVFQWKSDTAHDLANAYIYTRHFAEFDGGNITPQDLDFRSDGKAMYLLDSALDTIWEFPLAEPWDLKTIKWLNQSNARSVLSELTVPTALHVRSNSYFYALGTTTDTVFEYSWVAGNAASATATGASFYIGGQETAPQGLSFKPDGTEMYVVGTTGDDINRYTMTTPWDIANASFDTNYAFFGTGFNPGGLYMTNNYLYYASSTSDNASQWAMSSEWDLSTLSHVANLSTSYDQAGNGDSSDIYGLRFSPDGLNLYLVDSRRVTQWKLTVPWVLSSASNKPYATLNTEGGMGFFNLFGLAFKYDGTKMYPMRDAVLGEYTLSTAWDISTATYVTEETISPTGSPYDVEWSYNGNYLYLVTSTTIYQYDVFSAVGASGRWDVSSIGSTSPTTVTTGSWKTIRVSDDGNLSYWAQTPGTIDVYELSTPYDLTTRTLKASIGVGSGNTLGHGSLFDGGSKVVWGQGSPSILRSANLGVANAAYDSSAVTFNELDVSSIATSWRDIVVKEDGTRMWATTATSDIVQQWNLSEAYNVASATTNGSFYIGSQESVTNSIFWSANGAIFYAGGNGGTIYKYETTAPWDINFASYTSESKLLGGGAVYSFVIPPDGLSFYAGTGTTIQKWIMDTPHDIINATQVWNDDPADFLQNRAYNLQYNSDGTKLWLFDYQKHSIRELKLAAPYDLDYMTIDEDYVWQFDTANAVINAWVSESSNAVFGIDISNSKITGFKGN